MGGHVPCNGERRGVYRGLGVNMKERNYSEDLGVDVMIILKWIFEREEGRVNRINLVQNRDKWRTLVKTTVKPFLTENEGNFN